ncbi:GNAT family N-acetyltransferase [Wenxinia saemankumensis]|uniref:Protein N-acetyltransferase, RimJ/RimL family n=1 Tax=Wenxinia saemankumensis TaxID=1447782 RepID=A0A1M6GTC4_9RHOB|nr:GNAT family N-acetyltransferase [Wenxinia saemankumensis]SHJ13215.1 Protein N-acetyltransferase, RimJ/RimL family [Wenxinia saemankumensis]
MERLETERLVLRRPDSRDWEPVRGFFMSERSGFIGGPQSERDAWRSFAAELGHWDIRGYGMWTVTRRGAEDEGLALIGPWYPIDWPETEIGWLILSPETEGTGIATEAARAAIDHAWRVLHWTSMVSYIDPANAPSIRVAERLGAVHDPDAPAPGDKPVLVYRHTRPEGA